MRKSEDKLQKNPSWKYLEDILTVGTLIKRLEIVLKEYGDIECWIYDENRDTPLLFQEYEKYYKGSKEYLPTESGLSVKKEHDLEPFLYF